MSNPREVSFHQSANRPHLILGGDRELVLFAGLISAVLVFAVAAWWAVVVGVVFWLASVAALVRMGKADPLMRHVYLKHIRYRSFYLAKGRIGAATQPVPASWR